MKKIIAASVFLASLSGAFGQTTFIETKSFGSSVVNFNETLSFANYAGDVGDIISVNWSYSLSISGGQMVVDNDSNSPASGTANFGANLGVSSGTLTLLDGSFANIFSDVSASTEGDYTGINSLAANTGDGANDYDGTGPDGAILIGTNVTETGGADVNAAFKSQYAGGGSNDMLINASSLVAFTGAGGVETASSPVNAFGTLTLTIVAVPEPSSALLSMAGLIAFGLRRRR